MKNNFIKNNCLNIYVSLPCPLKVPFKQIFDPFLKRWNSDSTKQPIYIPLTVDCSPGSFEELTNSAKSEDDLPDIYITSSYKILFSKPFYNRFLETNIFTGLPDRFYDTSYPQQITNAMKKYNVGFLGFSSWGVIQDSKYNEKHSLPKSWRNLAEKNFKDLISIHGCHGQAGNISMLMNLQEKGGSNAIKALADNVKTVGHFSKLIKQLGSNKKDGTPFYIMPNVAIANIPSNKKAELLILKESIISPLMITIKKSKLDQCFELLEFFSSQKFQKVLASHSYFQPNEIEGIDYTIFDHLEIFVKESYEKKFNEVNQLFISSLGNKITDR